MRRLTKMRAGVVLLACAALAGWLAIAAWPYIASAALLVDLSGSSSTLRSLMPIRGAAVHARDLSLPTRHGTIGARLYTPEGSASRAIVVVPGIHAGGVDEPRLDRLSRRLAGAGAIVLSVPLPDLRAYRILPESTDMIEDAARWFAERGGAGGRVGLIGVSFSGGLAVAAAGRAALGDRLTAVVSLGGHGDLPRTLRYLCTGRLPDGTLRPPHDYGIAVALREALPHLVPASDLAAADRALVAYLDGSSLAESDPQRADALVNQARVITQSLDDPARAILDSIIRRDVAAVGSRLLPWVEQIGGHPALSPERSAAPTVPVFLIHGRDDTVIPSSETTQLAASLAGRGTPVEWLLTPIVSHADLQVGALLLDQWRLVRFWTAAWRALAG